MARTDLRRAVPRTDVVLADPRLAEAHTRFGREVLKRAVHAAQQEVRSGALVPEGVVEAVLATLGRRPSSLRPVLNATGVVLHTNLGRAPLSAAATEAITLAAGYTDVEYDVHTGARARRGAAATTALRNAVPAAQDALVVNNGAAALVLAATALAAGRKIIVSRGELVEIGDGFRIPELIASTGARLHEVGTTNRTNIADYAAALGPDTGFILKVHPSNFAVRGFTSAVSVRELAGLGVPVVADIGSGLLRPEPSLPTEPDAQSWLAEGATVVTASGDKLLGGPQAGLVLGEGETVHQLRKHPLARALRVDKLTLAAFEATLTSAEPTPVTRALHADADTLRARADRIARELAQHGVCAEVVASDGVVGGGGAPEERLPGWAVALPQAYAELLRVGEPCVVGRVEDGRCLLDPRCIPDSDDERLILAVRACA
ncbi:L-seryl-tRNA(Sec) selenium transferase [Amycolatopsis acidicola]|uniref:L-seryl-tRNA(Sec) selenium transferase n=1 Tax=Amycolatopsis acidicola TaxID=2596893 RepID=A0A5N0VGN1_9PSEU|nr:L-seryl-tRNA(Sec) selenium transferase [Amycolatopsis acidicola]KAA9163991.1 L-seryl-tRNA(Sec) selenium transferase [Amycolatopsis acidicola]